jgi:hypothetical protein
MYVQAITVADDQETEVQAAKLTASDGLVSAGPKFKPENEWSQYSEHFRSGPFMT